MLCPVELRAPALFSTIYSHGRKGRFSFGTDFGTEIADVFDSLDYPSLALIGRCELRIVTAP